jgi:hypothetical protein
VSAERRGFRGAPGLAAPRADFDLSRQIAGGAAATPPHATPAHPSPTATADPRLQADPYPQALARHARVPRDGALEAAQHVVRLLLAAGCGSLQAVRKKYSTAKFCEASAVAAPADILDEVAGAAGQGGA